ncbi:DUF3325 family protein [Colwellia sp. Arc7-635]|jgi:hypothetical protein|uniref:DUF3325 family protein n=1 Tax=Colwellia sp. Arc7-635 TaxID=2497879 RepID=UPI000F851A40|nr:DUF3325 family protein [Colwellia sp. Arc7-635]AZQ84777.1 DUF3325 family protein [Colwellia sp. Arc7-635]
MLVSIIAQAMGLICLSLAMNKHFKLVFNSNPTSIVSLVLTLSGWLLISLSILLVVLLSSHISIAVIYWLAILSINILLLTLIHCRFSLRK